MRYDPGVLTTEGPVIRNFRCSRDHEWSVHDSSADQSGSIAFPGIPDIWCVKCLSEFLTQNVGTVLEVKEL